MASQDIGVQVLRDVYKRMQVDAEWSEWTDRSFRWWGGELCQIVSAGPALVANDGTVLYRLTASTEIIRDIKNADAVPGIAAAAQSHSPLNAFVYDAARKVLSLRCSAFVHEQNEPFISPLFALAVALQVGEAHAKASYVGEDRPDGVPVFVALLNGAVAESRIDPRTPRSMPDDMLNFANVISEAGSVQRFGEEDVEEVASLLRDRGMTTANGGVTCWVPFGISDEEHLRDLKKMDTQRTAQIRLFLHDPHPTLGEGAIVTLELPPRFSQDDAARTALRLNLMEQTDSGDYAHGLGGWLARPQGILAHHLFIPSMYAEMRSWLPNLAINEIVRTQWAVRRLADPRVR